MSGSSKLLTWLAGACFVAILAVARPCIAHEARPAFLKIEESADHRVDVLWKQPTRGDVAVHLVPQISGDLLGTPSAVFAGPGFAIQQWRGLPAGEPGLRGRVLQIEGLENTITSVVVFVSLANGRSFQYLLSPHSSRETLDAADPGTHVFDYLGLGSEHILTGADHLAFVMGMLLIVRQRVALFKTITAFTVAHSLTLGATALHVVTVQPAMIECMVALSVVFVAAEGVNGERGRSGLTARYPWLVAFAFGLLHGCAFAGALADAGLPSHGIAQALFLFNCGVEIGQLLFIALVLSVARVVRRLRDVLPALLHGAPAYLIGSGAAFICFDRLATATSI